MVFDILARGNTSLASRKKVIDQLEKQENVVATLVQFTFDENCKVKVLASIVLDDLLQVNPYLLDEYISTFIEQLPSVRDESVKRLTSKMAILLVEKRSMLVHEGLEEQLLDQCLVWLTSDAKVATEANAMHIIMLLCKKFPIQAQLIAELIEVRFAEKTPAYQSKARKLLKKVSNLKK
ncbi:MULTISPECIES: hypothetical protein [unclassified Myroides]|uniref:hypothetical protein n=1 Tax=unclassified Myroides TaxID=2642485 RepID=UPI003D2F98C5